MGNGTDKAGYICAREREVNSMSHLAIFEYQWEQKSFLDWPCSSKECSGVQLGIEEIHCVWTHCREFNHPEPSPSPCKALMAESLTQHHTGSDMGCSCSTGPVTSGGQWAFMLSHYWGSAFDGSPKSSEQNHLSCQTRRTEGAGGGQRKSSQGMENTRGLWGRQWHTGVVRWLSGEGMTIDPFSSSEAHWCLRRNLDILGSYKPWFYFLFSHLPSTESIWNSVWQAIQSTRPF